MWKKSDSVGPDAEPVMSLDREPRTDMGREAPPPSETRKAATIGPSIAIHGDVVGDEDLIVQGRIEGTLKLPQHNVTVGKEGRVKADVHAKVIEVQGQLQGDMHGDEQVIIRRSGNVQGNILAPRVTLEDGCHFRGSIDMEAKGAEKRAPAETRSFTGLKAAPPAATPVGAGKESERLAETNPSSAVTREKKDQKASGG